MQSYYFGDDTNIETVRQQSFDELTTFVSSSLHDALFNALLDTLFDALIKSLMEKLMVLPGDTDVLPGHGHPTSIARESATNPFLTPFNEPDTAWWSQDGIELDGV